MPLQTRFTRPRLLCAAALAVGAFVACESPFEPRGLGERVPIGHEITDDVTGDTVAKYSFVSASGGPFVVFLEALAGTVQMGVIDSTDQYLATYLYAGPTSPPLDQNPSATFQTEQGDVFELRINALPGGSHAFFRFLVYPINTAPEQVSNVFALGDTVSGETIDPMVDLDEFLVHGQAGQEFVAVAETPAPPGSGAVILTVIDPVAPNFLGYVIAEAGPSPPFTTGRVRLTATHDYKFILGSVTSNQYPRYQGPYRFWTYVINRAPEHRSAPILFDTAIGNERIDRAGDVDEFTFFANAGAEFNAFVQSSTRAVQLEVVPPSGPPIAAAGSQPSDTSLFAHGTSRFQVPQTGTYVVRVTGTDSYEIADTGGYRFYVYAIDRRPEHVPQAITPGDTVVGEDIGLPGDMDEFTFSGAAGEEFVASFQALNGSPDTRLQLDVVDSAGTVMRWAQSVGTDTSLLGQVTGRFALPVAGTYRLRVSGVSAYGPDPNRGPYRLFLYRIDRHPETLAQTLAFGDSLSGERIALPGDVDEFHVTVPDSSGANLAVAAESTLAAGLPVQLVDSATGQVIAATSTPQAGQRAATGRMHLGPGRYIVRVGSSGDIYDRSTLHGPYRLWFYRFGFGTETVSDTFAVGDTVSGESLEPWGDQDEFHFFGLRNQHVNIMVQGLGAPSGGYFQFEVVPPPGAAGYAAFLTTPTATGALGDVQTTRLDLPATGWYTVFVNGYYDAIDERGPYRFTVLPIDPGPEHVSDTLTAGDSVVNEPIDAPGDWDEFTVVGTPGQTMSVLFDSNVFTGLFLRVFDPVTDDTLAWQANQFRRIAGPFLIPASGHVKISVAQPGGFFRLCYNSTCGGLYGVVGTYRFHVIAVNRAPENIPAAFAVGDTVRGETISPIGDFDEFTATGTPGEQLTLLSRLTTQSSLDSAIVVEAIDPATGASLVGSNAASLGTTFFAVGTFTVPASGTFIVRAHVYGEWGYGVGETSYEFLVKRGP